MKLARLALVSALLGCGLRVSAWDYEEHRVINELALATLPKEFGIALTPSVENRIEFLGGEPDRWRNVADLPLKHLNGPDHYLDLEDLKLSGMAPGTLPMMRYDFAAAIARARALHPESFPPIDPTKDADHTRELAGFLPWTITEYYERLKSDFGVLKAFRTHGGTAGEIANAHADAVYVMGVMGHYVGDGSQPLHTTACFNGWSGPNPNGYTVSQGFHAWIDGGYFRKTGGIKADGLIGRMQPAERVPVAADAEAFFRYTVNYLVEQNRLVEPLYRVDKAGELSGQGERGLKGRQFLEGQLVAAAQMLGNLWLTAWLEAPEDTYLERQLDHRARTGRSGASRQKGNDAP